MNEPSNELQARLETLEAREQQREAREQQRAKRTRLLLAAGIACALATPFAARALGAVPNVFSAGSPIVAADLNANFAHVVAGVTAVEARAAALEGMRTVFVSFGGTVPDASVCSSSPCTIWRQSGEVAAATRSGPGEYVVTFSAGTFSGIPTCTCVGISAGVNETRFCTIDPHARTARFPGPILVKDPGSGGADGNVDLICVGPR